MRNIKLAGVNIMRGLIRSVVPNHFSRIVSLLLFALLLMGSETVSAVSSIRMYLHDPDGIELVDARWQVLTVGSWRVSGFQEAGLADDWWPTLLFEEPEGYYPATNWSLYLNGNLILTNTFRPWTNDFSVTLLDDNTNSVPTARWSLTTYPSSFTYTTGTGDLAVVSCPTGNYTIAYSNVVGYKAPSPQTNNITGAQAAAFTGLYERLYGDVFVLPCNAGDTNDVLTNATWVIESYPADYPRPDHVHPLSGTGEMLITNAPVGVYTVRFGSLAFYGEPVPNPVTHTNIADDVRSYIGEYGFTGRRLTVRVVLPGDTNLAGVGTGFVQRDPVGLPHGTDVESFYYPNGTDVFLTAIPSNMVVAGVEYQSFFFEWNGRRWNGSAWVDNLGSYSVPSTDNPIELTMDQDRIVTVLFSRERYPWDNVGDISGDGLPDEWVRSFGLNPKLSQRNANPLGKWIPSANPNAPSTVSITESAGSDLIGGVNWTAYGGGAGYPLSRNRLITAQDLGVGDRRGYAGGVSFTYFLESRGLDGFYGTNGGNWIIEDVSYTNYPVASDDPGTDPTVYDTENDGVSDGWKYYFWRWRSADAYNKGLTNSANLGWVTIHPNKPLDKELDSDEDGLLDFAEYSLGTDPTHADTDGDGMDDYWEDKVGLDPLNYLDSSENPDLDYMAIRRDMGVLQMTNGIMGEVHGTLITNAVYYTGSLSFADVQSAWIDISDTTNFTMYTDTVLVGRSPLINGMTGTLIASNVYYGMSSNLPGYQAGYPVWVDIDSDGIFTDGVDVALINPCVKHDLVYMSPPSAPGPGVTSFNPLTAWFEGLKTFSYTLENLTYTMTNFPPVYTERYNSYQEYLGGNYHGRVAWDAGGKVVFTNDIEFFPDRNASTNPFSDDTDNDGVPDGWELYVGMDPHSSLDAVLDPDGDDLNNRDEWANTTHILSLELTWNTKLFPTDPGVIIAPSPNDPHPADTDWDGLSDGDERTAGTCPTRWDTDFDFLPDGWELYAGSNPLRGDATEDPDGDGLLNWQEYWTGTVPEWMMCDPAWNVVFLTRQGMSWDSSGETDPYVGADYFMPPSFMDCPSFRFQNGINTDLDYLRRNFPAAGASSSVHYHTTLANNPDSDEDGMDDYWEVFHGLNPLQGRRCLMLPGERIRLEDVSLPSVASPDARPDLPGFQFGLQGNQFTSAAQFLNYIDSVGSLGVLNMVGPFNFGLEMMDPDGDGLPNLEEYSYHPNSSFYHTSPTPMWRTFYLAQESFVAQNYGRDSLTQQGLRVMGWTAGGLDHRFPFKFGVVEGFDTDGDLVGDYYELNPGASSAVNGNDPLDPRNPMRNRVLKLDGTNDFARTPASWVTTSASYLTRFCVEAWINPDGPTLSKTNAIIMDRSGFYPNPYGSDIIRANFRLGVANGRPYIMYNGRGAQTAYQATASQAHRLTADKWTHLAGVYDGTYLTLYINGEASTTIRAAELPATGYGSNPLNYVYKGNIVGARDITPGGAAITDRDHFGGYIDQLRVWNGSRTRGQIREYKERRIFTHELTNSAFNNLVTFYSFDDVPDPTIEGIVPGGMRGLNHDYTSVSPVSLSRASSSRRALLVGINQYLPSYGPSPLNFCVADAQGMRDIMLLGDPSNRWGSANIKLLTDAQATKANISSEIAAIAAASMAGDIFVYYHSGHGGQTDPLVNPSNTFVCAYNADYYDSDLAADLAAFHPDVKVFVIIDTCHSGGMFKFSGIQEEWPFAKRVMNNYIQMKSAEFRSKGFAVPKALGSNIAFMTACDYDELSWETLGHGVYTGLLLDSCALSEVDTNNDGEAQFLELHVYAAKKAAEVSSGFSSQQNAQAYNVALLGNTIVRAFSSPFSSDLLFHPTLSWWANNPTRSTVYTGSALYPYNYIVMAKDHVLHKPIVPPMDDYINMIWTGEDTNRVASLPDGYKNTTNPYHEWSANGTPMLKDLYLRRGARGVRPPTTWLPVIDPDNADSVDSDGDGLPDWWEVLHGLDPLDPTGINGAWGDPDNDGLNNLAEYQAGTDPWSSDTSGDGVSDYDSSDGSGNLTYGELYSDGDGMPDDWEMEHGLDPNSYDAHLDLDGDGWSNYAEYQAGTDPNDPNDFPRPVVSGTVSYYGSHSGTLRILAYQNEGMSGTPVGQYSGSTTNFTVTGLKEGDVYLFGFLDLNGNGVWDPGEPCGVAHDQPIKLSWSDVDGVVLGLSDAAPGYGRFRWTVPSGASSVDVTIKTLTGSTAPLTMMLTRTVRAPRNYMHEWDYQLEGFYGFPSGSYQWWAGTQSGTFNVNWKSTQDKPVLLYPRGDVLVYAQNKIGWTMDRETTAYYLQIYDGNLNLLYNEFLPAPYPDKNNEYWSNLPYDANDLGDGVFYWRVAGYNPDNQSEWSDLQSFSVRLSSVSSRSISGEIYYYGKVWATNLVLEVYNNPAFSGRPVVNKTFSLRQTANPLKTTYTLRGLRAGAYYVRSFIDTSPAGPELASGREEFWSTSGFIRDTGNTYRPAVISLYSESQVANTLIVMRDKDTDNDNMPDAWEIQYFGNLDQTGEMDYDGDGETNLDEYKIVGFNTNPTLWDTSRNLISDRFARFYDGTPTYNPYCPVNNPKGTDLYATRWSTDGSGYSDGAQLRRYRTNPLDPRSVPDYLPECFGSRPAPMDFDGDGRSDLAVYDKTTGQWHIITWYGKYSQLQFGDHTTRAMPGDFDGDGVADLALYDRDGGYWYIFTSAGQFVMLPFGNSNMIPVPGDYSGDWRTDFGLYDTVTGYWYILSWDGQFTAFQFGGPTMIPVPGDYNADGRNDFAVYDTATGYWYIFTWDGEFYMLQFGNETTIPVPGDYDGDDRNDFALFHPETGYWYIFTWKGEFRHGQFGWADAVPVPGDFSGDGRTDLALYCPDSGNWYIYCWSGNRFYHAQFGGPGMSPVLKSR